MSKKIVGKHRTAPKKGVRIPARATARIPALRSTSIAYKLKVSLMSGPVADSYDGQVVARVLLVPGELNLYDLHDVIFEAFDREEEHLWEFLLGGSHLGDPKNVKFGPEEIDDVHDAEEVTLSGLDLQPGDVFGYLFDFGDNWEHVVEVLSIETGSAKKYQVVELERIGASPPQYPDYE